MKKGFVSAQFNWIFVALAGAFILFLVGILITNGKDVSDSKVSVEVLQRFDSLFNSIKTNPGVNLEIPSRKSLVLEVSCIYDPIDDFIISKFQTSQKFTDVDLENVVIYAPAEISGDRILAKTMKLTVPFRVDNTLFLTDSDTLYISIDPNPKTRDYFKDLLPTNVTFAEYAQFDEITNKGFDKTVLIVATDEVNVSKIPKQLKQKELEAVFITRSIAGLSVSGNISFHKWDNKQKTFLDKGVVKYSNEAHLLGAILTGDKDVYDCTNRKLEKQIEITAQILAARSKQLSDALASRPGKELCTLLYLEAAEHFVDLSKHSEDYLDYVHAITTTDAALVRQSCPTLY
ncbi:MAG: hypothetical protein ACI8Y7_000165 [Candidatus Woesearchaeota archaeon]